MKARWMFALVLLAACEKPSPLQPGQWELSVKVDIDGADFPTPPAVYQKCVTAADAQHPAELFRPEGTQGCQLYDIKLQGNNLSWTVECKGSSKGSARVTFNPDGYDGIMRLQMLGNRALAKSTLSGRRLGGCR